MTDITTFAERRKPGSDYAAIATLGAAKTSFRDDRRDDGQDSVYRIRAFNAAGDITYSPSLLVPAEEPQP